MAGSTKVRDLANPKLLEQIDELFKSGVGEYVALPQLLVVGDQSSGKSSVLEGLTGLPFPRDKVLCTCFATQILFKRDPVQRTMVSIIPDKDASKEHTEEVEAWKKSGLQELNRERFTRIMIEARDLMGLGRVTDSGLQAKSFSDDVLKIEIWGPDEQHLTVIDIPGIFRKPTPGVTTKQDMVRVKQMAINYMRNERAVILAVVPANADLATQDITQIASDEADSEGQRTLGVLTKPDLVDKGGEPAVLDVLAGRQHPLNLGWFVVRNQGQKALDAGDTDRNQVEKNFFETEAPWHTVRKDQAGIFALKERLVGLLEEMVQREFPKVKQDLNRQLKDCRQRLKALGPSRTTRQEQHDYMFDLATRFQVMVSCALRTDYGSNAIFDTKSSLRLATRVVDRNDDFSEDVHGVGHTMEFRENGLTTESDRNWNGASVEIEEYPLRVASEAGSEGGSESDPEKELLFEKVRRTEDHWELDDILIPDSGISEPETTGILDWLEEVYKTSRGFEIGTFDATIFPIIFKKQSCNWEPLALGYISDIISHIHGFILDLTSALCPDKQVQKGIMSAILDSLMECYKKSLDHARFILGVERAGTPLTVNHYFNDNLRKRRLSRSKAETENSASRWTDNQGKSWVSPEDVGNISRNMGNVEHTVNDLHDILEAYYKVARKRFVDVMCMQAADHYLVNGQTSPLRIFSPAFVNKLSEENLDKIAGEAESVRKKRTRLQHDIEVLEKGRRILM